MPLEQDIALIPLLLDEVREARRELGELRDMVADRANEWVTPARWAKAMGVSVDTAARRIERGEVEVRELARVPLRGRDGEQLVDREGRPRFRRTLRVRLTRPIAATEVRAVAREISA